MSRTKRNRAERHGDDIFPIYLKTYAWNYFGDNTEVYAIEYARARFGTSDVETAKERCMLLHFTENAKYLAPRYRRDDFNIHERKIRARLQNWRHTALRIADYEDIDGWLDLAHNHISGWAL